jgi:5'-AMP-activated protein kinase catalytic alpha subunit
MCIRDRICGHLPFDDDDLGILYDKILKGNYEITAKVSSECIDLLTKILVTDPKKRYNIQQIKSHEWMKMRFLFNMPKRE